MDTSYIQVSEHRGPLGLERRDYRWIGKSPVTKVDYWSMLPQFDGLDFRLVGKRVSIGPFQLRVLEFSVVEPCYTLVREDYPLWWALYLWHRLTPLLDLIYRRTIITLAVWKLAEYREYEIPTWRDIHALRWIAERLGR